MNKTYLISCFIIYSLLQLFFIRPSYADFINGGFEDSYIPSSANTHNPITGWTLTGYTFGGATTVPPTSLSNIALTTPTVPGGITDIISGTTQSLYDYFLLGATPTPTLLLPMAGLQTAMINLRSIDGPLTKAGTGGISGWVSIGQQATSVSQQMTVQAADIDPIDGKVHVRFIAAPVLENPTHPANQQPFIAFQLNNITTGRTGSTPLFFQWNYASQPGVPWNSLTAAGTNLGSNTSYQYVIFQAFDIAPGNAFIHVGDTIELVALASGCAPGGHDGHMYLDDVGTSIPTDLLWVSAIGPVGASPGSNITYTYTYINTAGAPVNNVQVVANLPLPQTASTPSSTAFVSVTTPTAGTSPSCSGTGPVTCNIGTLQPGETGTFQLTVNIPSAWSISHGPINNGNYPISGQGLSTLLGPLVQTNLLAPSSLSNLMVNISNLPTAGGLGLPYSGTVSCANIPTASASGDAPSASCDVASLPAGLSETGCTISPSNTIWIQPADIPSNQTVTCAVTGTPTTAGSYTVTATANANNNVNSTSNQANLTITVDSPVIPATVNGSPILDPASVCCGRPVILGPLSVSGAGPTSYTVSHTSGNVRCLIGHSGSQTFLKMNGSHGSSCTVIGTKNGIMSAPFTVTTP